MSTENEPLVKVAPEFFVRDVGAAVRFYVDKLDFVVLRQEPVFAVVALGDAHVLLAHESIAPDRAELTSTTRGVGVNVRIMVDDVDAVYERAKSNGVRIVHDIADREYGLRDFILADEDGFMLRFAQEIAK
jgi:uncharacterized glyoxalase superfamily protein PhnB